MLVTIPQISPAFAKAKTADQSVTSSVVLANETDLVVPVGVGETWIVTWNLYVTFASATGLLVAVTTPSGASQLIQAVLSVVGAAIGTTSAVTTVSGTSVALSTVAVSTAGLVTVTATIVNGATAGNVTLQFTQTSAGSATPTTVKAASCVLAKKV